jgi:hypothetical protein
MSFIKADGKTKIIWLPMTASEEINDGALVSFSSGKITAASDGDKIVGVIRKTITSSDDDYADSRDVPVEVPVERYVQWEADVTSGLVATDVGLYQDITDDENVDRSSSTNDMVMCTKVISSTKGLFVITNCADLNN